MQELLEWMEYIEDTRQQTKVRHTFEGYSCHCVVCNSCECG